MASARKLLNCSDCRFRAKCEWSVLSKKEVEILDQVKTSRHFEKGELVFMEGQPSEGLYCIASGQVSLYKSDEEGDRAVLHLSGPGETLGYQSLLARQDCSTSAEAIVAMLIFQSDVSQRRVPSSAATPTTPPLAGYT